MLQAEMFESLLMELNVKEVNILAHDLGDTVAMEMLARQVHHSQGEIGLFSYWL